jgi:hypothetical protein
MVCGYEGHHLRKINGALVKVVGKLLGTHPGLVATVLRELYVEDHIRSKRAPKPNGSAPHPQSRYRLSCAMT